MVKAPRKHSPIKGYGSLGNGENCAAYARAPDRARNLFASLGAASAYKSPTLRPRRQRESDPLNPLPPRSPLLRVSRSRNYTDRFRTLYRDPAGKRTTRKTCPRNWCIAMSRRVTSSRYARVIYAEFAVSHREGERSILRIPPGNQLWLREY